MLGPQEPEPEPQQLQEYKDENGDFMAEAIAKAVPTFEMAPEKRGVIPRALDEVSTCAPPTNEGSLLFYYAPLLLRFSTMPPLILIMCTTFQCHMFRFIVNSSLTFWSRSPPLVPWLCVRYVTSAI